ncbi:MAG: YggT family protein [Brevinematia bacterium]
MSELVSAIQVSLMVLAGIIRVYQFILFIRVIFSFIILFNLSLLNSRVFSTLYSVIYSITEPPLNFLRNHLPSRIGFIDLSVLWLFLILELLYMVIMKTITVV